MFEYDTTYSLISIYFIDLIAVNFIINVTARLAEGILL
jgi:hypothetical protein